MQAPAFNEALKEGTRLHTWLGEIALEQREIGRLFLPSGRIVAGDPMTLEEAAPLDRMVPAGDYPVSIYIAHLPSEDGDGDQRVALALVRFSDTEPDAWQMAMPADETTDELEEDEGFGYGVDSGTGCFLSLEAAEAMQRMDDGFIDVVFAQMQKNHAPTRDWADVLLEAEARLNLVAFSSGVGDGFYSSYWGLSAQGEPVCLLTDFGLLDPEEPDDADQEAEVSA